ncbi:histidine-type phosphatase [Flammeovirga aprica]|uniref:Multiple inositol polyphosphate phosphatase 1 n=1 Tax=Flammeovirga aprica JL-4 TaxID=694437 RepID=A0A7X9X9N7_9BACT|nr:histidine-type phosphatase [Flammeovirga aprica]NME68965.1 histidine phosphatase family protein [Flammeovirga aprica JL-4]
MTKYLRSIITITLFLLTQIACQKVENSTQLKEAKWHLGSKQNYIEPIENIELPDGYQLSFIAHVARHGSRFMSGPNEDIALFNLMNDAEQKKQLTEEGKKLLEQVKELTMLQFGRYGRLTQIGRKEHYDMAQRLYQLDSNFFKSSDKLIGNATYKLRTQNSRGSFIRGLTAVSGKNSWEINDFQKGNDPLLRFHKITPKYKAYKDSALWLNQINDIVNSDQYRTMASNILPRYFNEAFLEQFESGEAFYLDGENEVAISSRMDIVLALFECFKISFGIPENQRPDFMIFTHEQTELLAKVGDIETFYAKGPGYPKRNVSYSNSIGLLMDLTNQLKLASEQKLDYQGYFNFAHAETTLPLLVYLNLNEVNRKTNNFSTLDWSSSDYAMMATNLTWMLLEKKEKQYIQIRFNEIPATLPIKGNDDNVYALEDYLEYVESLVKPYAISDTDYETIVSQF